MIKMTFTNICEIISASMNALLKYLDIMDSIFPHFKRNKYERKIKAMTRMMSTATKMFLIIAFVVGQTEWAQGIYLFIFIISIHVQFN